MRDLVQQVTEDQKKSKEAKEKLLKLKQRIGAHHLFMMHKAFFYHLHLLINFHAHFSVREVSEQNRELLHQTLEEEQAKLCRKFKVTHEAHSIESLPRIRFKKFDDTEVSDRNEGCHFIFCTDSPEFPCHGEASCFRLQAMR